MVPGVSPCTPRHPGGAFFPRRTRMATQTEVSPAQAGAQGWSAAVSGVIAGLFAGAAYLAAQVSFTGLARAGGSAEPLQRIAAILLGPDAAPPGADMNFTILGMAVLIHFGLAMAYGRLLAEVVWGRALLPAIAIGAVLGLALFGLNFELIAPSAFPWFQDSVQSTTMLDHMVFGAIAAAACVLLRRRFG